MADNATTTNYTYTPGETNQQFVAQNISPTSSGGGLRAGQDFGSSGVMMPIQALTSYNKFQADQKGARQNAQNIYNANLWYGQALPSQQALSQSSNPVIDQAIQQRIANGNPMSQVEISSLQQQYQQYQQQQALTQQVQSFFSDPNRQALEQQTVQDQLNATLGGLAQQYQTNTTSAAEGAGNQGLLGSSVDIGNRAQIAANQQSGDAQAGATAQQQQQQLTNQDTQLQQQLLGMVNSSDPSQAAAAQAQLTQLGTQQQQVGANTQLNQAQQQLNQFGMNSQSQALGNGVNGLGNALASNPTGGIGSLFGGSSSGGLAASYGISGGSGGG